MHMHTCIHTQRVPSPPPQSSSHLPPISLSSPPTLPPISPQPPSHLPPISLPSPPNLPSQFAELFEPSTPGSPQGSRAAKAGAGVLGFGVEPVPGGAAGGAAVGAGGCGAWRAYIEDLRTAERFYLYLLWLEDWTSNPFARSKYLRGKLVYQRRPVEQLFYARPFSYKDGVLSVASGPGYEERLEHVLPPDSIKLGCEV